MRCFHRLVNMFFYYNPFIILKFFIRISKRKLRIKFIVLLKIILMFHIKRDFLRKTKSFRTNILKQLNKRMSFFLLFVKNEKINMFGERTDFYNMIRPSMDHVSLLKYNFNVGRKLYSLFVNYRLSRYDRSIVNRVFYIRRRIKRNIFFFYYFDL